MQILKQAALHLVRWKTNYSRALVSDGSGDVSVSDVTATEMIMSVSNYSNTVRRKTSKISSSDRLNANLIHDGTISNTEFVI